VGRITTYEEYKDVYQNGVNVLIDRLLDEGLASNFDVSMSLLILV